MLGRRAVTLPCCPVTWALGKQNLGQFICPMLPDGAREFPHGLSGGLPGSPGFQKLHLSLTSLTPPTPHSLRLQQEPPPPGIGHSCGKKHSVCSYATRLSVCVCVGVLCFYKLPSLVVMRLKQFSPSVNASLPNHWRHIIRSPFSTPIFLGTGGNGNSESCFLRRGRRWHGTSVRQEEVAFP